MYYCTLYFLREKLDESYYVPSLVMFVVLLCVYIHTFNLLDEILKKIEIGKNITTAWKNTLNLVKLQCLVVKCGKL